MALPYINLHVIRFDYHYVADEEEETRKKTNKTKTRTRISEFVTKIFYQFNRTCDVVISCYQLSRLNAVIAVIHFT